MLFEKWLSPPPSALLGLGFGPFVLNRSFPSNADGASSFTTASKTVPGSDRMHTKLFNTLRGLRTLKMESREWDIVSSEVDDQSYSAKWCPCCRKKWIFWDWSRFFDTRWRYPGLRILRGQTGVPVVVQQSHLPEGSMEVPMEYQEDQGEEGVRGSQCQSQGWQLW